MTYQKQEWVARETVVSAARMNHIEEGIEEAHNLLPDSGWIDIPLRDGFEPQPNYSPRGRRIGSVVYLSGGISGAGITSKTSYTVADLPSDLRPSRGVYTMGGASSADSSPLIVVNTTGSLEIRTNTVAPNYCLMDGLSYLVD